MIIYGVLVVMTILHVTDASKTITEPTVYLAHSNTALPITIYHATESIRSILHSQATRVKGRISC